MSLIDKKKAAKKITDQLFSLDKKLESMIAENQRQLKSIEESTKRDLRGLNLHLDNHTFQVENWKKELDAQYAAKFDQIQELQEHFENQNAENAGLKNLFIKLDEKIEAEKNSLKAWQDETDTAYTQLIATYSAELEAKMEAQALATSDSFKRLVAWLEEKQEKVDLLQQKISDSESLPENWQEKTRASIAQIMEEEIGKLQSQTQVQMESIIDTLHKWATLFDETSDQVTALEQKNALLFSFAEELRGTLDTQVSELKVEIGELQETLNQLFEKSAPNLEMLHLELKNKPQESKTQQPSASSAPLLLNLHDPVVNGSVLEIREIVDENGQTDQEIKFQPAVFYSSLHAISSIALEPLRLKTFRVSLPKGTKPGLDRINGKGTNMAIHFQNERSGEASWAHGTSILQSPPYDLLRSITLALTKKHFYAIDRNIETLKERIDEGKETMIGFDSLRKVSRFQSIFYFLNHASANYDLYEENEPYRQALLANIIDRTIEIYERIQYHKSAIKLLSVQESSKIDQNLQFLLVLKDLFLYGKLLAFKYAATFNSALIQHLLDDFKSLKHEFDQFFQKNHEKLKNLFLEKPSNWYLTYTALDKFSEYPSEEKRNQGKDQPPRDILKSIIKNNKVVYKTYKKMLKAFSSSLEEPQIVMIKNGTLYDTNL